MTMCFLDIETRSTRNVTVCGAHELAQDPDLRLLCVSYAIGSGPVKTWNCAFADGDPDLADPVPDDLLEALSDPDLMLMAWNAAFERLILNAVRKRYQLPALKIENVFCVMTWARCFNLPGSLATCTKTWLPAEDAKLSGKPTAWMWSTKKPLLAEHEKDYREGQVVYCEADVSSMREIYKLLPNPTDEFIAEYHAAEYVNDRGCMVDRRLINAAITLAPVVDDEIRTELDEITGGEVKPRGPSLRNWLDKVLPKDLTELLWSNKKFRQGYGWGTRVRPSTDKNVRARLLEAMEEYEGMEDVRDALALYDEANRAAVTKYSAARDRTDPEESCLRGQYLFSGASQTGRFSATGVQVHNLIRMVPKDALVWIDAILSCDPDHIRKVTGMTVNQALSRVIRTAFLAEVGHVLVWGDWSAIEARMLPWLSGDEAAERVLDAYRENKDLYIEEAAGIYGIPADQIDNDQRQAGKVVILACLAADTRVIVRRAGRVTECLLGDITPADEVFDGAAWVTHQGLVKKGERECLSMHGVTLTPDHQLWCGPSMGWMPAEQVASNAAALSQALATASDGWSSLGTCSQLETGSNTLSCNVTAADLSTPSAHTISTPHDPRGVETAPRVKARARAKKLFSIIPRLARMTTTGAAFSTASRRSTPAAIAPHAASGAHMVAGASPAGGKINMAMNASGPPVGQGVSTPCGGGTTCWSIFSPFRDGMTRALNWIAETTTKGTRPETSASWTDLGTCSTDDQSMNYRTASARLSRKMPVFDLLNAGPRNRFMIMSDAGPLIVHNCGYNGGVGAYQAMAKNYGIKIPDAEASRIVKAWRTNNPWARRFWRGLEKAAILAIRNPKVAYPAGRIKFVFVPDLLRGTLLAFLPSGRPLAYPEASVITTEKFGKDTDTIIFRHPTYGMTDTYGGKIAENVTQGESASLLRALIVRLEAAKLPVVLHVHDEVVAEVPRGKAVETAAAVAEMMVVVPDWAPGLPLAAEVEWGERYKIEEGKHKHAA